MTLYQITRLSPPVFDAAIADGTINPDMTRKQLRAFQRRRREQADKALIVTLEPSFVIHHCAIADVGTDLLADTSVDAIVTDPPYHEKALPLFSQLARFADRTLKLTAGASS
jgi:hypothetical protein